MLALSISQLYAVIFASGAFGRSTAGDSWNFSRLTADGSWNLTRAEENMQILRWETKQPGIWNDKDKKRRKRLSTNCPENQYPDPSDNSLCCRKCPAGSCVKASCKTHGGQPQCEPCPGGTYLAFENYLSECQICKTCDKMTQTTIRNCTATSNTECMCKADQYQQCHYTNCTLFHCLSCSRCHNREVIKPCSQREDAQCGECLPGFYPHGDQCKACTEITNEASPAALGCLISESYLPTVLKTVLSVLGSLSLLFVMVQLLRCKFQRTSVVKEPRPRTGTGVQSPDVCVSAPEGEKTKSEVKELPFEIPAPERKSSPPIDFPTHPLANNNIYGTSLQASRLQPETQVSMPLAGRALYEIINLVPVRRWKELMRLLRLKECDIERIEMDVTHSRDQQYEMLRQWSQQQTASVESLYQALEIMNLTGLAEELKAKLLN
ncbi:tumor necrosis factor receptor superfamily member 25-like isoform X1 [Mobula hypostoma]|uniref:tumor necrosis factor receptor superfamily member 25-like isoform X1 n=2 Tax=Mobula hypostoma TaxID=723540 RepID=UPI002FC29B23